MNGPAIEQMPPVLVLGAGLVAREYFGLPVAVVDDFGKARQLAQPIEQLRIGRLRRQPVGVEQPQLAIGLVEERKALVGTENGDRRGDAIQRALVGGHVAAQFALRRLQRGNVDGGPRRRAIERQHHHVVRLARAAADDVDALAIGPALRQRSLDHVALPHFQQFDLAFAHLALTGGLDRPDVGVVDPLDAAVVAPEPHRHRQRIEQRPSGLGVAHEQAMLVEDARQVALASRHVAQAQNGPSSGGPPVGFDISARSGLQQLAERPPVRKQRIEPPLELPRGRCIEPRSELQEVGMPHRQAGNAGQGVRHHAHALALLPEHQNLGLGLDDGFRRQQVLAELCHLLARMALVAAAAQHGRHRHRGREHRAAGGNAQDQNECRPPASQRRFRTEHHDNNQRQDDKQAGEQEQSHPRARPAKAAVSACQPHVCRTTPYRPTRNRLDARLPDERDDPAAQVYESVTIMWAFAGPGQSAESTARAVLSHSRLENRPKDQ